MVDCFFAWLHADYISTENLYLISQDYLKLPRITGKCQQIQRLISNIFIRRQLTCPSRSPWILYTMVSICYIALLPTLLSRDTFNLFLNLSKTFLIVSAPCMPKCLTKVYFCERILQSSLIDKSLLSLSKNK